MRLILLTIILITLRLAERIIFIFQIMHRFIFNLWPIKWCLPIFVMRFGRAWRANRLLTILSAFCFGGFILFSITFPPFSWINCVLYTCFFWKTLIRKLKSPTLLLKKFICDQSFRSDSDFSLVCNWGFCFSMRLHRCLLIVLLQNKHRLNSCAFRFPLSIIWLRFFVPPFLLGHTFVI